MTTPTKNLISKLEEQKASLDNSRSLLSKYDQATDKDTKKKLFHEFQAELGKLTKIEKSIKIQYNNNKEQGDYLSVWSDANVKRYRHGKTLDIIKAESEGRRILMNGYPILSPSPTPPPIQEEAVEREEDASPQETSKEKVEKQLEAQKVQEMTPEEKEKKLEQINKENEEDVEVLDISTTFKDDEVEEGLKTIKKQAEITNHGETIAPDIAEEIPEEIPAPITEEEIIMGAEALLKFKKVPPKDTPAQPPAEPPAEPPAQPPAEPPAPSPADSSDVLYTPQAQPAEAIPTFEREIPRGGQTTSQQNISMSIDKAKSIDQLKEEIKALHIVYDSKITSFKEKAHTKDKDEALQSNDISKVRKHHASMMEKIRLYYNTGGLKLGVIIDAQDYINNQFSFNIPTFSPVDDTRPIMKEQGVSFERGGIPRFSRTVNYKQTYIRGGMAHSKKEPIRNRIPSYIPRPTKHHSLPPVEHTTNTRYSYTIERPKAQIYTGINLKSKKK